MSFTVDGSLNAVDRYIKMLESINAKPVDMSDKDESHKDHLLHMCMVLKKNITYDGKGFSVDKFSRWLGFIQYGLIFTHKLTTVRAERDITRPWFTGTNNEPSTQTPKSLSPEELASLNIPK